MDVVPPGVQRGRPPSRPTTIRTARPARLGTARPARLGTARPARLGTARLGTARPARLGTARPARLGTARPATPGPASPGTARPASPAGLRRSLAGSVAVEPEVGVAGSGSNLLIADVGVRGLVLKLAKELSEIDLDGTRTRCGGGARLPAVSIRATRAGLSGIGFRADSPALLGLEDRG